MKLKRILVSISLVSLMLLSSTLAFWVINADSNEWKMNLNGNHIVYSKQPAPIESEKIVFSDANLSLKQFILSEIIALEGKYPTKVIWAIINDVFEHSPGTIMDKTQMAIEMIEKAFSPIPNEVKQKIFEKAQKIVDPIPIEDVSVPPPIKAHIEVVIDNIWNDASADHSWGTAGNWSAGHVPTTDDRVIFRGSITTNSCNNLTLGVWIYNLTMESDYTGTITQSGALYCINGYSISNGIWNANYQAVYSKGSFTLVSPGVITSDRLQYLQLSGGDVNAIIDVPFVIPSGNQLYTFTAQESCHVKSGLFRYGITISAGKTVTIDSGGQGLALYSTLFQFTNNGILSGAGSFTYAPVTAVTVTCTFGDVRCPVVILNQSATTVLTLGADTVLQSSLTISTKATINYTVELKAGASNRTLAVTGITTVGRYGILTSGTGQWDLTGGLVQNGTNSVITQGGTINSGAVSQSDGILNGNASYVWSCSSTFSQSGGTFTDSIFRLTMTSASTVTMTSASYFDSVILNENTTWAGNLNVDNVLTILTTKILTLSGNFNQSGTFNKNSSTVKMTGTTKTITMTAGQSFYDLTLHVTSSITLASNIAVTHTFLWDGCAFSLSTFTLDNTGGTTVCDHNSDFSFATAGGFIAGTSISTFGNVDIHTITFTKGTSVLMMYGDMNLNTGTNQLYDLTIVGEVTQLSDLIVTHNMVISNDYSYSLGNNHISVTNAFSLTGDASIVQGTGEWIFGSFSMIAGTITQGATITSGIVTASGGNLNLGNGMTWICTGNWNTIGTTLNPSSSIVSFTGTSSISLDPSQYFYNLTINTAGTITQSTDLSIAYDWEFIAGTFIGSPAKHIYLSGNATISGTLTASSTNLNILSSGTSLLMNSVNPFNRLQINGSAVQLFSTAGIFAKTMIIDSGASAIVNQDSSVTTRLVISGSLNTNTYKFTISGSNAYPLYANGSWTGTIYLTGSAVSFTVMISELSPGWINLAKQTIINIHSAPGIITIIPTGGAISIHVSVNNPTEIGIGMKAYAFELSGIAGCTNINVTFANLYNIRAYTLVIDSTVMYWKNSTGAGIWQFDYNSTTDHRHFSLKVGSIPAIYYPPYTGIGIAELWATMLVGFIITVAIVSVWRTNRGVMKEEEYWHNRLINKTPRQSAKNQKNAKQETYWQDRVHKIKKNWK